MEAMNRVQVLVCGVRAINLLVHGASGGPYTAGLTARTCHCTLSDSITIRTATTTHCNRHAALLTFWSQLASADFYCWSTPHNDWGTNGKGWHDKSHGHYIHSKQSTYDSIRHLGWCDYWSPAITSELHLHLPGMWLLQRPWRDLFMVWAEYWSFRSIHFFFNQDKNAQRTLLQDASNWTQLPFWPEMESTALPPLSDPALPPCSAGEVRSVEPSVAAVLPTSSSLPGADAVVSDRWPPSREPLPCN